MKKPEVHLYAVVARNGVLPEVTEPDLAAHRANAVGNSAVLLGRRAYMQMKDELRDWANPVIVVSPSLLTDEPNTYVEGGYILNSFVHLHTLPFEKIYVLGGATTFRRAFEYATHLDLALLAAPANGDLKFPGGDLFQLNVQHGQFRLFTEKSEMDWKRTAVHGDIEESDTLFTKWKRI